MKISAETKRSVKDTIGYSEADNKASFITGSQVAFTKSEMFYDDEIKTLTQQRDHFKSAYEQVRDDIKMIARIFKQYEEE